MDTARAVSAFGCVYSPRVVLLLFFLFGRVAAVETLAALLLLCSPRACTISSMTNYFYKMRGFPLFFRGK